ncbi:unnamed protein product [Allacma fusca]|uniref:Uncharacterized protein n=1 Tax=Allacma fusca TaxID=39272 RepID=A0A8J2JZP4_9HEXA|nr:unnamed protein product [Allacma fusca]
MSGDSLSAGIGILARNSLSSSRRQSQVSLLVDSNSPDYSHHIDDRNWSWSYLRSNFRINDLSELYDRYVQRLQNAYYVVFLLLQISISLALICILLVRNQDNYGMAFPEVIVHVDSNADCFPDADHYLLLFTPSIQIPSHHSWLASQYCSPSVFRLISL